jgi:KDO2-lipid IV(A) lauroyltransferase
MYRELSNKKQNALLLSVREEQNLFMVTANIKGVLKLQRAVKNDQLVIILPDQYRGEEKGVLAPFFGQNIRTMTLLVFRSGLYQVFNHLIHYGHIFRQYTGF